MFRTLRRLLLLLLVLLVPAYAVSWMERLDVPAAWSQIGVGDDHAAVRAALRRAGMADKQCEWLPLLRAVRCTLVGRHHAAGLVVRFDGTGGDARVAAVEIRTPVYTGPFHLHARIKRYFRSAAASADVR
jgi:hypothetical protein